MKRLAILLLALPLVAHADHVEIDTTINMEFVSGQTGAVANSRLFFGENAVISEGDTVRVSVDFSGTQSVTATDMERFYGWLVTDSAFTSYFCISDAFTAFVGAASQPATTSSECSGAVHIGPSNAFAATTLTFSGYTFGFTVDSLRDGTSEYKGLWWVSEASSYSVAGDRDIDSEGTTIRYFADIDPNSVAALGDIDGDGSQDIVALVKEDGTLTATVRDAEDRSLINTIAFDANLVPVDLEVMADINANGAPELVVLGTGSTRSEIRDSLTGEHLGEVGFDPELTPIDLELVADQTGNVIPELAMLGRGSVKVEVKDPLTQVPVNTLNFNDNYVPKDLSVWPIGESMAVGVLGESKDPARGDKIEVRDLDTGDVVRHLWVGKGWNLLQMELLGDLNGNGSPEAAILREHPDDQRVSVLPVDTVSGSRFTQLGFDPNYRPIRLRVLDDVNGNGFEEIAVLAVRRGCCNQKVWVKDARTGESIQQVYFGKTYIGVDLDISPDINGNGAPELVVLGRRDDGVLRAIIKDSKTGEFINSIGF